MLKPIWCAWCNEQAMKEAGEINRARRSGLYLYCSRACAGLAHRNQSPPTPEQKVAAKAEYDAEYRRKNRAMLQAKKRAYHLQTYDPEKAAEVRKQRMPLHVEYCRRPEYREKKAAYDRRNLAEKHYGPFAGAALALRDLEGEVADRMSRYEIYAANGTLNKVLQRRKADGQTYRR